MKTFLAFVALAVCLHAADRPNILWLVSEDNSARYLKLYDKDGAEMPNIESLAAQGLVFNHAFSNAPVCSVARSTLITGCYAPRIGAQFHRKMVPVPLPEGLRMFPTYLREAGYHCTNNSKEDYNLIKNEGVWDESSRKASYKNRESGQPFFHVQNFGVTHEGQLHFKAKAMKDSRGRFENTKDTATADYLPDTPTARFTREWYLERHRMLDGQIGSFLEGLKADGLMEDTIIFYYGDHGGVLPRSKGYVYESGLHVPLVVAIPGKWKHLFPAKAGERIDGFVSFADFGPTVLNLAGAKVPDAMDGKPFLGKGVTREALDQRNEAFGYADRFDEKCDPVRTCRRGQFKYMRSYQPGNPDLAFNQYRYRMLLYKEWRDLYDAGKLDAERAQFFQPRQPEALYDLEADPFELHNLAGDPQHRNTLLAMRKALTTWVKGMPDLSFYPESHLIANAWDNPTQFGQQHANEIAELADIADLSLLPFAEAKPKINAAIRSKNPWKRYWGIIAAGSFGKEATGWSAPMTTLAKSDPENLVRMRAAEFLGLTKNGDPVPLLTAILKNANSPAEAVLILNTMTVLHDGPHAYRFPEAKNALGKFKDVPGELIRRRLEYLSMN
jgi:arylsulfatase A-like enzyme